MERRTALWMISVTVLAAAFIGLSICTVQAQRPKHAPLTTRWAKDVDANNPLPEYPRPQMVRKDWMSLNGHWQFQSGLANDPVPTGTLRGTIVVPYPPESILSGLLLHFERLWYKRAFTLPPAWVGKHVLLHFGAVDYEAEVFINGKSAGTHKGGYDPFTFDITPNLVEGGPQEILVRVFDPTDIGGQPRGKQTTNQEGIMYTPTSGIWQTVWLEPLENLFVRDLKFIPDIDSSQLHLTVNTNAGGNTAAVHVVVKDGESPIQSVDVKPNTEVPITIAKPKLWSPDSPFLYGLEYSQNSAT